MHQDYMAIMGYMGHINMTHMTCIDLQNIIYITHI